LAILSAAVRRSIRSAGLDCLGSARLAMKTLIFEGWKSLDFLGFSRLNRAFSMGYAGFSLNEISLALSPPRQARANGCLDSGWLKGTDRSSGKLNSISDFAQAIAAQPAFCCRLPKATRF
jgi:hypothetical protein